MAEGRIAERQTNRRLRAEATPPRLIIRLAGGMSEASSNIIGRLCCRQRSSLLSLRRRDIFFMMLFAIKIPRCPSTPDFRAIISTLRDYCRRQHRRQPPVLMMPPFCAGSHDDFAP